MTAPRGRLVPLVPRQEFPGPQGLPGADRQGLRLQNLPVSFVVPRGRLPAGRVTIHRRHVPALRAGARDLQESATLAQVERLLRRPADAVTVDRLDEQVNCYWWQRRSASMCVMFKDGRLVGRSLAEDAEPSLLDRPRALLRW